MKALSVKQPWANMIASGRKTIETRTWSTPYRGPIVIVSTKQPKVEPAGCAVAVAELVDCRPMTYLDEMPAQAGYHAGTFAWVLRNIRRLEPVPIRGYQGLYGIDLETGRSWKE